MKALVKQTRNPGDLRLEDIPEPSCRSDQILAEVAYAGICRSDFDIIDDKTTIYRPPVVLGHEFSARVVEVGRDVSGFSPGDKVVSETALSVCDNCQPCADGFFEICDRKEILGWTHNGGFAEYVVLNPRFAHRLNNGTDLKTAALAEPLAIATETMYVRGNVQPGESVVVVGPGPSGILSALVAMQLGAERVFLVGRKSFSHVKMPLVQELGIAHAIDSSQTDPLEYLLRNNQGRLADVVVDATGTIEGFNLALSLLKRHGRLIELGSITSETPFDWPAVCRKALDFCFVFASGRKAWLKAIEILEQKQFDFGRLITQTMPLDGYAEAFSLAADGAKSAKVVLQPRD